MTDHEFLAWLYDRLTLVYHESPNMDFVRRLRRVVDNYAPRVCADGEHEITEMCWRCGREAHEIYGGDS